MLIFLQSHAAAGLLLLRWIDCLAWLRHSTGLGEAWNFGSRRDRFDCRHAQAAEQPITWAGLLGAAETAVVLGDPTQPGLDIEPVVPAQHQPPAFSSQLSRPPRASGTWWVGTGTKYDPDSTVAMNGPGSYVLRSCRTGALRR